MTTPIETQIAHRGKLFSVEVLSWQDAEGRSLQREVVRHPGAVLIVPALSERELVLVRNVRVAVGARLWELPAGTLEAGEAPAAAAARELTEETGYRAARIDPVGEFYTSPGFCDELMHVFAASDLEHVGQDLDEGEDIEVDIVTVDETMAMIDDGRIRDGKTIASLAMWLRQRDAAGTASAAQGHPS